MSTTYLAFGDSRSFVERQLFIGELDIPGDISLGDQLEMDLSGYIFNTMLVHPGRLATPSTPEAPAMLAVSPDLPSVELRSHLADQGFYPMLIDDAPVPHIAAHYVEVRVISGKRFHSRHMFTRKQWISEVPPVTGTAVMTLSQDGAPVNATVLVVTNRTGNVPLVVVQTDDLSSHYEAVLTGSGWRQLDYGLALDHSYEMLIDLSTRVKAQYVWLLHVPFITGVDVSVALTPEQVSMLPADVRDEYELTMKAA